MATSSRPAPNRRRLAESPSDAGSPALLADLDRLTAEVATLRAARRRRPPSGPRRRLAAGLVGCTLLLLSALPLVALAVSDIFSDVPSGAQFHDDVEAIALAGITTGCSTTPLNFCPDQAVTRRAMAAFMHRGMGRVHQTEATFGTNLDTLNAGIAAIDLLPGLPSNLLTGAAAFVKVDTIATISTATTSGSTSGCPCTFSGQMSSGGNRIDGSGAGPTTTLDAGDTGELVFTGVVRVTTNSRPAVSWTFSRSGGSGRWEARTLVVVTYYPFGGTGTNSL